MPDQWIVRVAEAKAAHDADIESLAELNDDQLLYLAGVQDLEDPVTDGIGCDAG